ncbi:MAG: N-acetyl-gamma-glutamyl-phosphate reductase [Candidatus Burarchaeum sp.]|nr:N-acetyl-gamma-glutamyl-phosphate reductase [Candidatus Burarchaeum sp.]MDO8339137.1 N-acetyl-gamma-glutamyl-phosphate reductase [Candidatus Burarchaeum sp.]
MANTIRASIIGASGYTGGELLRLLLMHPQVQVKSVSSEKNKGMRVTSVHPNLRAITELEFVEAAKIDSNVDVLFLCTPHGASVKLVEQYLQSGVKIIDLSADFRLHNAADYPVWYGHEHPHPELLKKFVYGMPELHREEIRKAHYVASPGCLATSAILALAPVVAAGLVDTGHLVVDAKIGSSAGGARADASTHHPERAGTVRAYKPTGHRHTGEIEQELSALIHGKKVNVSLSPHAIELVRGIFSTAHCFLVKQGLKDVDLWKTYRSFYKESPFIRLVKEKEGIHRYPEPKLVMGTNFCDIGFELDWHAPRLVVMSAIDNLVKGSGGQAIQSMNLMCGLDEKTGLWIPGMHPV